MHVIKPRHFAPVRTSLLALSIVSLSTLAPAQDAPSVAPVETSEFQQALISGRTWANMRYRAESVNQDPFTKDALGSTLRTVLGYETGEYRGFRLLLEFEDVAPIGNDKLFNSTTNGQVLRPVVADPDGTEINQVYMTYGFSEDLSARVGRQEINYGDHRFIGNVGWRQNHQSFDAVRLTHKGYENTTIDYAFLHGVNRIFGENSPAGEERLRSHLLDIRHKVEGFGELAAYAYLLDFDQTKALNSNTYGIRFGGQRGVTDEFDVLYQAEYADQSDAGSNPTVGGIDTEYYLAELGVGFMGAQLRFGNEHLGGSGMVGDKFSTPFATLHKFNGFADVFLATPDTGLEDRYVTLSRKLFGISCAATYHMFEADTGNMDYGGEFDMTMSYPVTKRLSVGARYANFNRDGAAPAGFQDTEKVMGWVTYSLL